MDLYHLIRSALDALGFFASTIDSGEPWAQDEEVFEEHFGVSYGEFSRRVKLLSSDQQKKFTQTIEVNPEAAVLWVISMNEIR